MSKLKGLFRKQRGSIGDVTFRQLKGQTVVSEKSEPSQPRTLAQMVHRTAWRNIQNFYQSFNGNLHPSFESRPQTWSDYNAFISANIGRNNVYLTQDFARQGGCVVTAYQITRGSLPSIGMGTTGGGVITSDLKLGSLAIGDETTLAAFSAAIIANNEGWAYGDQLSAFVSIQNTNTLTGVPYVTTECFEVTLLNDPETLLVDLIGQPTAFGVVDQKLALAAVINGGACYVHSRKGNGRTLVSTQFMHVTNSLLSTYTSQAARDAAVISYGGKTSNQFLTPNLGETEVPVTP